MTTFSQLVDSMVLEFRRPDMRSAISNTVNQIVREIHSRPGTGSNVGFDANRCEDSLLLIGDGPYQWAMPSVTRFQILESALSKSRRLKLRRKTPQLYGRGEFELPYPTYYQSGAVFCLDGVAQGDTILFSYFLYPARLAYYSPNNRPVSYDTATDQYLTQAGTVATDDELLTVTNWVLARWTSVLEQGVRAALHRMLGDVDRARLAYSAYEQARGLLWQSEATSEITLD